MSVRRIARALRRGAKGAARSTSRGVRSIIEKLFISPRERRRIRALKAQRAATWAELQRILSLRGHNRKAAKTLKRELDLLHRAAIGAPRNPLGSEFAMRHFPEYNRLQAMYNQRARAASALGTKARRLALQTAGAVYRADIVPAARNVRRAVARHPYRYGAGGAAALAALLGARYTPRRRRRK